MDFSLCFRICFLTFIITTFTYIVLVNYHSKGHFKIPELINHIIRAHGYYLYSKKGFINITKIKFTFIVSVNDHSKEYFLITELEKYVL